MTNENKNENEVSNELQSQSELKNELVFGDLYYPGNGTSTCEVELNEVFEESLEADIVFIVDESGSMQNGHQWISKMIPSLERNFKEMGISARYAVIGYASMGTSSAGSESGYGQGHLGRILYASGNASPWGTAEDISRRCQNSLVANGGYEDGYAGIHFAIENLNLNPKASKQFILITDDARTVMLPSVTYNSIIQKLDEHKITLHTVVNARFKSGAQEALGGKSGNIAYIADGNGTFHTETQLTVSGGYRSTIDDYVNMVFNDMLRKGTAWDVMILRQNDNEKILSFTNAFSETLSQNIVKELIQVVPTNPDVTVTILDRKIANGKFVFSLNIDSKNSISTMLSLLFVNIGEYQNLDNPGIVYGAIPVAVTSNYRYNVVAYDPDGDTLTYELTGTTNGAVIGSQTGKMRWTPTTTGSFPFHLVVSDGNGGQATQDWSVAVSNLTAQNKKPVFGGAKTFNFTAGNCYKFNVTATDQDKDTIRYYLMYNFRDQCRPPMGMSIQSVSGEITWDIPQTEFGPYSVFIMAMDSRGAFAVQEYNFNVERKIVQYNNPPYFVRYPLETAIVNNEYKAFFQAVDPDGDDLVHEIIEGPVDMRINSKTGQLYWKPDAIQQGWQYVTVRATDPQGKSRMESAWILVKPDTPLRIVSSPLYGPMANETTWKYPVEVSYRSDRISSVQYTVAADPGIPGLQFVGNVLTWNTINGKNMTAGDYLIKIDVKDPYYVSQGSNYVDTQKFWLRVTQELINSVNGNGGNSSQEPNVIDSVSTVPETFRLFVGQEFTYTLPQGDNIGFTLQNAQVGMRIENGQLRWTAADVNPFTVNLVITFKKNGQTVDTQTRELTFVVTKALEPEIVDFQQPPLFNIREEYLCSIKARDPNPDGKITYSLANAPGNMKIDSETGDISWTPVDADSEKEYDICIAVTGKTGLCIERTFTVSHSALASLDLLEAPKNILVAGELWKYDIRPNTNITACNVPKYPDGMEYNDMAKTLTWRPPVNDDPDKEYQADVEIEVKNEIATLKQTFTLMVIPAPVIPDIPAQKAVTGELYQYQVVASEFKDDIPTYKLKTCPTGMNIDAWGKITWTPTSAQTAVPVTITIEYGDVRGTYTRSYSLQVLQNTAPVISVTAVPKIQETNKDAVFTLKSHADIGTVTLSFQAVEFVKSTGEKYSYSTPKTFTLSGNTATVKMLPADLGLTGVTENDLKGGTIRFRATATTGSGATLMLASTDYVFGIANTTALSTTPFASILTPAKNQKLDRITEVYGVALGRQDGTASTANWTLRLVPKKVTMNGNNQVVEAIAGALETVIATGTTEKNGLLGKIDTTLLKDGWYQLELSATNGTTVTTTRLIEVDARLKLGNYSVSFVDYESKNPKFPIKITRTYNTLDADRKGDFGYGWTCDVNGLGSLEKFFGYKVQVDITGSGNFVDLGSSLQSARPIEGTKIRLLLPDGTMETFVFQPDYDSMNGYFPKLTNIAGGSKAAIDYDSSLQLMKNSDGTFDAMNTTFVPCTMLKLFGNLIKFVISDGTLVQFEQSTGSMKIGENIMVSGSSNPRTITFGNQTYKFQVVSGSDTKITKITLPDNKELNYTYTNDCLATIKYPDNSVVTCVYDPVLTRYLKSVTDSLGRVVAMTEYNNGRISKVTDAAGNVTTYNFDVTQNQQTVTGPTGTTTIQLDGQGNILYEETPGGAKTSYTYKNNLPATKTVKTKNNNIDISLTTKYEYDGSGHLTKETDPQGNVTENVYNDFGQLIATKRNGKPVSATVYDTVTNLPVSSSDANGNTTNYAYKDQNLTEIKSGETVLVKNDYDTLGRIVKTVANGRETSFVYDDATGNCKETSYTEQGKKISDSTDYDAMGRVTKRIRKVNDAEQWNTTVAYDSAGQVTSEKDQTGLVTTYKYDKCGRKVQTITETKGSNDTTATLLYAETVYDAAGRVTASTENHLQNAADALGTVNTYDADGRITKTEYYKGMAITVTTTGNISASSYTLTGATKLYETTTAYNSAGWVLSSVDQYGLQTQYVYNNFGNVTQVKRQSPDETGTIKWLINQTLYDDLGRVLIATDTSLEGAATTFGTKTVYDEQGRVRKSIRLENVKLAIDATNGKSTLTSEGTAQPASETRYDSAGRVAKTISPENMTTSYEYDSLGRQTKTITNSLQTVTAYDSMGRVASVTVSDVANPTDKRTTSYLYDAYGNIVKTTNPDGLETQYVYNNFGNVIQVKRQSPDETGTKKWLISQTLYDDLGRVLIATDTFLEGAAVICGTKTVYDEQGRVLKTIRLENVKLAIDATNGKSTLTSEGTVLHTSETRYDDAGCVTQTISPEGITTSYEYDSLGRQTKTLTNSLQTVTAYDSMGRVAGVTVSDVANPTVLRTTSYLYDVYGNIVKTTNPDGSVIKATFNAQGQKVSETNQLDDTRTFEYDTQGRLTKVIMPKAKTTDLSNPVYEYAYDAFGNQTLIRDPLGHETRFTYDSRGNQLTRTLPGGQVESCTYDAHGRPTLQVLLEGTYMTSEYDAFGRLATKNFYTNATTYAAGTIDDTVTFQHDVFGRERVVKQSRATTRTYTTTTTCDPQGRVATLAQTYGTTTYTYDKYGRQTSVALKTGEKTTYTYDSQGRLATVKDVDNQTTSYEYDAFGNRSKTTLHNGVITTYTYDLMNRLTLEESKKGATLVSRFEYEYDALGQKIMAVETHGSGSPQTTTWEYDALSRLTKETMPGKTQEWTYDAVGNRLSQKCGTQTTAYSYNANDQLTDEQLTDTANAANNRLTKRTYNGSRMTQEVCYRGTTAVAANRVLQKDHVYTYDGRFTVTLYHWDDTGAFQLREFVRTFADHLGQPMFTDRYSNPVNDANYTVKYRSEFVYDRFSLTGHSQVMREAYNDTVPATAVLVRTHAHTFGHERISEKTTIAAQPTAPQTYFFVHDGHGNTRCLTNNLGAAVERYSYDAFGNAVGFEPSQALTQFLYCGEQFDTMAGWYYLRARYYDPKVGRFNRLDPFFGNLSDPQSLHKYTYCHGDPINFIDPMGMAYFFAELGKAAHKLISDLYDIAHPKQRVTYGKAIPGYTSILPDIMNYAKGQIGEIKPCSAYGFATGPIQLWAAINIANSVPVAHSRPSGGPWKPEDWQPGIQILLPGTIDPWFNDYLIVTLGNLNGLILYKALHMPLKTLSCLVVYMLAEKIKEISEDLMKDLRFGFDPILEPLYDHRFELLIASLTITGAAAWGVATRNTIETARGNAMMAISSLLSMRITFALT